MVKPAKESSEPVPESPNPQYSTLVRPRNIHLSDGVYLRLRLLAVAENKKVSSVAEEVLDAQLPHLEIRKAA